MRRCEREVLLNIGKQSGQDDALDKWKSTDDRFHERIAAPHNCYLDSDDKDALDVIKGTLKVYGGNCLHEIIKNSELVGDMIWLMATAATQQSGASEEIRANIEQIAKITQETAAGSQESAKAVHELLNLATHLHTLVSKFRVNVRASDPYCASLRPPLSPTRASIRGKTEAVRARRLPFEPA
jgi:hypothetical protein